MLMNRPKRLPTSPVPVRRPFKRARAPSLRVVGRVESEEPGGDADVGSHVFLGGDVADAV